MKIMILSLWIMMLESRMRLLIL
ncbi:hypothetical protein RJ641_027082 [Dillenia turbinata]|uniref:Uncharacterized protein n=1 Tax=Dillenia turbinata TaxID=194707 RepID=A0AAN8VWS3_9MAGN